MLELRKKGEKHWLLIDDEIGEFTPSKFTINRLNDKIEVVYFNNLESKNYNISDCFIFDISDTVGFNTSNGVAFMDKLEELNCPCFQKDTNNYYISGGTWGSITGNLSDQTDLQNALNSKLDKGTTTGVERIWVYGTDGIGFEKPISELVPLNFYDLYKRHMFYYSTGGVAGTPLQISISINESPTGTNVNGTNNVFARNIVSAATAGSSGEIREGAFQRVLTNKKFYFDTYVSNRNATTVNTERYFYGLTSNLAAFGNVDISTTNVLTSLLGMGCDSSDTNIFIFNRIESGVTNKIDTGFSKTLNHDFRLTIYKMPTSNQAYVILKNLTTDATFTTDFNFENTTFLNPRYHKNNGSTASAVTFGLNGFKLFIED